VRAGEGPVNYFPHHIGDFDRATRHLTRVERSIYRDLIDVYYDSECALPLDVAALCRKVVARTEEEKAAVLAVLDEFFHETPTGWFHDRCEEELAEYRKKSSQASSAGKASSLARAERRNAAMRANSSENQRESNDRGTSVEHPLNDRGTGAQQNVNELATNQEPITNNHKPKTKESKTNTAPFSAVGYLTDAGVTPQTAADWLKLRKAKKAPATQTALDTVKREAEKAGLTLDGALTICCSRGWQGFKAEWVTRAPDRLTPGAPTDLAAIQRAANAEAKRRLGIGQPGVIDAR
jgi:uncharacterized protein YdaU (DUF1376 family)